LTLKSYVRVISLLFVVTHAEVFAQRGPIPVEVATLVVRTLQEEVSFVATIEPNIATTVGAVVAGRVIRSDVREGDRVVARGVLMKLDPTAREIALREMRAAVEKARQEWERLRLGYRSEEIDQRRAEAEEQKALLARAKQDFGRAERLYGNELISRAEFERSQSEYLAAKEKHERTRAALRLAEAGPRKEEIGRAEAEFREAQARHDLIAYELDQTILRAPITGYLVKKYVEVGTWVNRGNPVVDLVDIDPVYATGPVGERQIDLLRDGLQATIMVDALSGKRFQGKVAHIIPQADPQSRTFPVKVRIPNRDGRLKSGMLARVTVTVGNARQGFLVPKDALVRRGADDVIFIVEDGSAREYGVKIGRAFEGFMEVENRALQPGQEIVIVGNESLSDGAKVRKVDSRNRGATPRNP
jgi:multidrug resistance efflux pump